MKISFIISKIMFCKIKIFTWKTQEIIRLTNQTKPESKKKLLIENDSKLENISQPKTEGMKKVRSYDVLKSDELSNI